jgi:hypothetical protein
MCQISPVDLGRSVQPLVNIATQYCSVCGFVCQELSDVCTCPNAWKYKRIDTSAVLVTGTNFAECEPPKNLTIPTKKNRRT